MITKLKTSVSTLYQRPGQPGMQIVDASAFHGELIALADQVMAQYNGISARFSASAIPDETKQAFERVKPQLGRLLKQMQEKARSYVERFARIDAPATNYEAAFENRYVVGILELPVAARITALKNVKTFAQSSALVRHGDVDAMGLPDQVVSSLREKHRLLSVVEMAGMRANFPIAPTTANPLPSGVDEKALFAAAADKIEELENERDTLDLDAEALVALIMMMASASNQSGQQFFDEIAA